MGNCNDRQSTLRSLEIKATDQSVKFVPRLGPLAISIASKKITAAAVEWKVTERRPPYPPLGVRQAS